ncbi:MAG: hypothetical protein LBE65_06430 [Synergistaceae bacterium]|jgi:hypothetical protein|nr:hypothetical protein [Synergistaceae bacterium]
MEYKTFEEELDAIRLEIYEEIKDMTLEEEIAYIKTQAAPIYEQHGIRHAKSTAKKEETVNV